MKYAEIILFFLCWTPVLLLTLLAVGFRLPALQLSICSSVFTLGLVVFFFNTRLSTVLLSGLDGILTTGPLLLVIFAGILLSTLLMSTGSLTRIVDWLMCGVRDTIHRNLLITLGVGNFMEGASVIAEPVVAPMLHAAGVAPMGAAALSIMGYAGLMTLELAGVIVTVLSLVTGLPVYDLSIASAWLSVPATVSMALCVPIFLPRPSGGVRRISLVLICGLLLGMVALGASFIGVPISGMVASLAMILPFPYITGAHWKLEINREIIYDLAPFVFMLAALLMVNTVPFLKDLTFHRLSVEIRAVPIHAVTFRPFFSAYVYLFIAFGLSVILLKVPSAKVREVISSGAGKGWRACIAMGLFGAMGQMIAYSGYAPGFVRLDQSHNIPLVLSHSLQIYTGSLYPVFVPLLGWVGTFLTGYGVASLMLFGQLQVQAAGLLGISATWLSAGLAVGASVGSVSSPFKIAIATPMCGALGQEGAILRWTIPLGIASSFFIGLILWLITLYL